MLALAQPSEAKIVYTPANVQFGGNGGRLNLDLNNDGITDFEFCVSGYTYRCPTQPGRRTSAGKNPIPNFPEDLFIFPATRAAMGTKTINQIWGHLTFTE
jgi:hypothetical protein